MAYPVRGAPKTALVSPLKLEVSPLKLEVSPLKLARTTKN